MGVLTETMTRLRDEIVSSRHARAALRGDLSRRTDERRAEVLALRSRFMRDRAGASHAWLGPTLSERRTAEADQRKLAEDDRSKAREERRKLAEESQAKTHAKTHAEVRPPAAPKVGQQRHESPVPAARPFVAPLPQVRKPPFKGSKKH